MTARTPHSSVRLVLLLSLFIATVAAAADDLAQAPVEKLIGELTQIDSPAPGLHSTALVSGFIAQERPMEFGGGVLGSPAPKISPSMRELVRRGPLVLPELIAHLDDQRSTKLTVGGKFFMFRYFSEEYDFRNPVKTQPVFPSGSLERNFEGDYTVKVGDVCYALIGQIVGRNLSSIRYQPTAGLVINSPLQAPILIERVRQDWSELDIAGHKASLLADARTGTHLWTYGPALVRLRFYYPDDYRALRSGDLKKQIVEFEASEKAR